MFDFTSLFHAVNASRIVERNGKRLLMALVGDSLLEVNGIDEFAGDHIFVSEFLANRFRCWSRFLWFIRYRLDDPKIR